MEGRGCSGGTEGEEVGDSSQPVACVVAGEEAARVSGAGVATDWTVAGWWGSVEGLAASPDCGQ